MVMQKKKENITIASLLFAVLILDTLAAGNFFLIFIFNLYIGTSFVLKINIKIYS